MLPFVRHTLSGLALVVALYAYSFYAYRDDWMHRWANDCFITPLVKFQELREVYPSMIFDVCVTNLDGKYYSQQAEALLQAKHQMLLYSPKNRTMVSAADWGSNKRLTHFPGDVGISINPHLVKANDRTMDCEVVLQGETVRFICPIDLVYHHLEIDEEKTLSEHQVKLTAIAKVCRMYAYFLFSK